jgi:tetratricopeptide (TPR) repeat protein
MQKLTLEEIARRFETSKEFNEIFDAFEQALEQHVRDMEIYRRLFWNQTLSPDELCLFGEKLAKELPDLAYDLYLWLATVFEATHAVFDNHELAFTYYQKAAAARPGMLDPYLDAAGCYERDLNIPPLTALINFLREGVRLVSYPAPLYERLVTLYEVGGNDEMAGYYRRKLRESSEPPQEHLPEQ